jgi:hypothetical protein
MKNRLKRLVSGCLAAMVASSLLASPSAAKNPSVAPSVINGQSGHPWNGASVYLEIDIGGKGNTCTGGLWKPQVIVTAAHCVMETDSSPIVATSDVRVWPPGANIEAVGPADVQVTSILADWGNEVKDIAFLTLSAPIGSTPISRLASEREVADLIRSKGTLTYIGYGLTVPRNDPIQGFTPIPLWLTQPLTDEFASDDIESGNFTMLGDGITSTCAGDSGGPLLYETSGEVLLVGPLSGGTGLPCEPEDVTAYDNATTAAAFLNLANQALATVNLPPVAPPIPRLALSKPDRKYGTKVVKSNINEQGLMTASIRTRLKKGSPIWVEVLTCDNEECDDWTTISEKKFRVKKKGRVSFTTSVAADQFVYVWDKKNRALVSWLTATD